MNKFDVLSSKTPFKGALLLEASAGTGKTFTLQHLFIRHLLEGRIPQEIVVITFTRAATRELKNRLRKGVKETLEILYQEDAPDYLRPFQNSEAEGNLRKALSDIDLTPIRTIHSFLGEVLNRFAWEGKRPLVENSFGALPLLEEKVQAVRDYLRSDLSKKNHLSYEEEILVSKDSFELEVAKEMVQGNFGPDLDLLKPLEKLSNLPWSHELLLDLTKPFKKGRKGDGIAWLTALAALLEKKERSVDDLNSLLSLGSPLSSVLEEENRRVKVPAGVLHHPEIFQIVRDEIIPLTSGLTDRKKIVKKYGLKIYPFYRDRARSLGPDDLLSEVGKLVENESFATALRDSYKVVLVDEFQDTDPIQWKILSTLFLDPSWGGSLTLVGDPKQAIYSFRNADLYTYFAAKEAMGEENCYHLTHNFRSHPKLINALNHLFKSAPLLRLPALQEERGYESVEAGVAAYELEHPPVTLVEAETEEILFDWMGNEIQRLENVSIALLVKDRYQGERLKERLELQGIHPKLYRTPSWEGDALLPSLQTLFKAIEKPWERERVIHLFATPFFRENLFRRGEEETRAAMSDLSHLREIYLLEGAVAFFEALLPFGWEGCSFGEWILSQEEGKNLFERLKSLFLSLEKAVPSHRFLDVYEFFEKIHLGLLQEESEEKGTLTLTREPLLMTIHMSKGLEFDVVFAPGVTAALSKGDLELEAEALRQLYVALTRPKRQLYLPIGGKKGREKSSLDLFMEAAGGKEAFITNLLQIEGVQLVHALPSENNEKRATELSIELTPPKTYDLPSSAPPLLSFSSIREASHRVRTLKNPGGGDFGTELHEFLALISLDKVRMAKESKDLLPEVDSREEMADLVFKAFKTPLCTPWGNFRLEEVEEIKMIREGEFLFIDEERGVFTGFIDVAFEHLGKIFLIDWKSHLLSSYDLPSIELEMVEGDYKTQENLYRKALEKHFGSTFQHRFGGSFFIFIRGLSADQKGVWYAP